MLSPIAHSTVDRNETTFIKDQCLHEGLLALHEIAHEVRVKKLKGVLFKLDFEKSYDRVNCGFKGGPMMATTPCVPIRWDSKCRMLYQVYFLHKDDSRVLYRALGELA
jgi:hypothetical protein